MSSRLRVLVPETASAPAQQVADALVDAGHVVTECHERGEPGLACAALRGCECPLEDGSVDVVVLVRPPSRSDPTPLEQGALCGVRRTIPLVVGGTVEGNPYAPWAAAEHDGVDLVRLVEDVAAEPLPEHCRVATAGLVDSLRHGAGGFDFCHAAVHRRAGTLEVVLSAEPWPSAAVREAAAVRVHQRLRALDRWTPRIEISFVPVPRSTPAV